MAPRNKAAIKAPNPFGEVENSRGQTQPLAPAVPAATDVFQPLKHTTVSGQPRETFRDGHGFVLTEYGWTKEQESDG